MPTELGTKLLWHFMDAMGQVLPLVVCHTCNVIDFAQISLLTRGFKPRNDIVSK